MADASLKQRIHTSLFLTKPCCSLVWYERMFLGSNLKRWILKFFGETITNKILATSKKKRVIHWSVFATAMPYWPSFQFSLFGCRAEDSLKIEWPLNPVLGYFLLKLPIRTLWSRPNFVIKKTTFPLLDQRCFLVVLDVAAARWKIGRKRNLECQKNSTNPFVLPLIWRDFLSTQSQFSRWNRTLFVIFLKNEDNF